jgi:transcriptional regulator with XRE-family HTH domain
MKRLGESEPITRQLVLDLIRNARTERALSMSRLEKEAGVPKDTVRDFERGKTHLIRPDRLQKVLNALAYDLVISSLKRK